MSGRWLFVITLTVAGGSTYSEIQDNLHVSGHGKRGDLETIAGICKSKYHAWCGTAARMRAYTPCMVEGSGVAKDHVYECVRGECCILSGNARKGERVEADNIYIDPKVMVVGEVTQRQREASGDEYLL